MVSLPNSSHNSSGNVFSQSRSSSAMNAFSFTRSASSGTFVLVAGRLIHKGVKTKPHQACTDDGTFDRDLALSVGKVFRSFVQRLNICSQNEFKFSVVRPWPLNCVQGIETRPIRPGLSRCLEKALERRRRYSCPGFRRSAPDMALIADRSAKTRWPVSRTLQSIGSPRVRSPQAI